MKICFVRHGETDWNTQKRVQGREDIPLNEDGRRQAEELGRILAAHKWDVIVSSPLGRAYDTAVAIGENCGISADSILFDIDLIERDFGELSGAVYGDDFLERMQTDVAGIETASAVRERVYGALLRIVDVYAGKDVIAVSHGGAINALLYRLSGGEIGSGKTWLGNASMSLIIFDEGEFRILFYGKTCEEVAFENMLQ